jgi:hypothetical protein
MIRCGGHYLLVTSVNGDYGHGLHVFNPQGLIDCLGVNGFKIVYLKYSTTFGKPISDPSTSPDVLIWMVGRKEQDMPAFICPQQEIWRNYANYAPIAPCPNLQSDLGICRNEQTELGFQ